MARKVALPSDTVEAMIETFTMVCFLLEAWRMGVTPLSNHVEKEMILKWCVEDADYATFRQHGHYIRDIFEPRKESE